MDAILEQERDKKLIQYVATHEVGLRNELVMEYLYIVRNVAKNTRGLYQTYATFDDIVNQGVLTLIDCLEKFDRSKGLAFEAYCYVRVKNATIDHIRKLDFLPRRVRQNAKTISEAFSHLGHQFMREPTDKEMADYLKINVGEISKHYGEAMNAQLLSVEEYTNYITRGECDDLGSEEQDPRVLFAKKEVKEALIKAIQTLNEREKIVISLYYYENLKLKEIASVLGVSEVRVCQMHAKAITKLKDVLQQYKED